MSRTYESERFGWSATIRPSAQRPGAREQILRKASAYLAQVELKHRFKPLRPSSTNTIGSSRMPCEWDVLA